MFRFPDLGLALGKPLGNLVFVIGSGGLPVKGPVGDGS